MDLSNKSFKVTENRDDFTQTKGLKEQKILGQRFKLNQVLLKVYALELGVFHMRTNFILGHVFQPEAL